MPDQALPARFNKPRLRRSEVPEYLLIKHGLPIAVATLAKLASVDGGPPFDRMNRTPLYRVDLLDQWAQAKLGN